MSSNARLWTPLLSLLLCAVLFSPVAMAFFPLGGVDTNDIFRYQRWDLGDFDTNNNGEVEPGEGLPIQIEGGPRGFNEAELEIVRESMEIWGDVPFSYAQFREESVFQDPIFTGTGDNRFTINYIVPVIDDIGQLPDITDGVLDTQVLGYNITLFAIEDSVVQHPSENVSYLFGAGNIIDSDIVIGSTLVRFGGLSLSGILVHELGHLLGLGHTPMNNLRSQTRVEGDFSTFAMVENPVLQITDGNGIPQIVGATPTMFPIYFDVFHNDTQTFSDGGTDLSPDDMSGVSWLYPRNNLANLFTITSQARGPATNDIPSSPYTGAHIVAWADHDNDPISDRIPLFSTLAGLYEPATFPNNGGIFDLIGLWKQMEVPGTNNILFNPTYTFTMNALNGRGLDAQAPPTVLVSAAIMDSLQGVNSPGANRDLTTYVNTFISETFHEVENIADVTSNNAGTPMVWSFERNTLVSADTGRSLNDILGLRPMFGDPNDVCPLNVIYEDTVNDVTDEETAGIIWDSNNTLRKMRDNWLLQTAIGTAIVDTYYQVSPAMAQLLIQNATVTAVLSQLSLGSAWAMNNWMLLCAILFTVSAMTKFHRPITRHLKKYLILLLLTAMLACTLPANAVMIYLSTEELIDLSDAMISGEVTATNSFKNGNGQILTDVTVTVDDTGKGTLNKGTAVTFTVHGGIVDQYAARISEIPIFLEGEQVLLYLKDNEEYTYKLFAGHQCKVLQIENEGKNFVPVDAALADQSDTIAKGIAKAAAETDDDHHVHHDGHGHSHGHSADKDMTLISTEDFMTYVRERERAKRRQK